MRSFSCRSLCMGRFLHSVQRTISQQAQSLVYHRSLRMAAHYSSGETHSGQSFYPEVARLDFEEMKRRSTFSFGNWMVNRSCQIFTYAVCPAIVGIGSDGVASSRRQRQDGNSGWHGEFPWKWKNTGGWLARRNIPLLEVNSGAATAVNFSCVN